MNVLKKFLLAAAVIIAPFANAQEGKSTWNVDLEKCNISTNFGDFWLTTDGQLSNEMLYFKMWTDMPLSKVPSVNINIMPSYPSRIEGVGRFFSFEMPYTPASVALMMSPEAYMSITWAPSGHENPIQASFALADLPEAIAEMSKVCGEK